MHGTVIVEFETKKILGSSPRVRRLSISEQHSQFKDSITSADGCDDRVTITAIDGAIQCRKTYTNGMLARETLGVIPVNIHLLNLINNRAAPTVEFIGDIATVTWVADILGEEIVLALSIDDSVDAADAAPNRLSPEFTYMTGVIESINSRVVELEGEIRGIKISSPNRRRLNNTPT